MFMQPRWQRTNIDLVCQDKTMNTTVTQPPQHASVASTSKRTLWIFGPGVDFWSLHAGAGLLVLPVALIGRLAFDELYTILMTVYSLALGFPHVVATHLRLNLDEDCRSRFAWLSWKAPLVIAGIVAILVVALKWLPYVVFAWFALQTWHANRQNYGIMRRYIRMAQSEPSALVNKTAGALIELFPWAPVLYACMWQDTNYQGYTIAFPALQWLVPLSAPLWTAAMVLLGVYLACEIREIRAKRFVPGRFLCCVAGSTVSILAWMVSDDLSWGYLVTSLWHSLQYVVYVQAFRSRPPEGASTAKLPLLKYIGLLFGIGVILSILFRGMSYYVPAIFAVIHLSMNFHHYLSDTLIWRRQPKPIAL